LRVAAIELLQRQCAPHVGAVPQQARGAQEIRPADAAGDGGDDEGGGARDGARPAMKRRALLALALAWVFVGVYGVWSYAHDYYLYRGFGPPRDPPGIAPGSLRVIKFRSAALAAERRYDIFLPPGYADAAARGQRFGVLYLLHGSPGWPRLFINAGALGVAVDTLAAHHAVRPFLVVMPDGRDGSFKSDTEWADTPHGRYESFVLDVVRAVDARWPTLADRRHRVLAGNSEGAYAAANLALRHPATFGAFEGWSGYYRQTRTGVFKHATAAQLRENSPIDLARTRRAELARLPMHAYLYGGGGDAATADLRPLARALRADGATVTEQVLPGRHDWRLWRDQTPAMLRWAARQMGAGR
jgi:enterochelin esterase-like enzyme